MNHLFYYLFIKPISLLPHWALYRISDFLYLLLYRLFKYRVKVVSGNIKRSFPEKSAQAHLQIERAFYSHFFDLIVEVIKNFSISEEEVKRRFKVLNPSLLDDYAAQGKSVFLVAGHYGNWELAAIAVGLHCQHLFVAIYHPLKSAFWNEKMAYSRSKLGLQLISKKEMNGYFERTLQEPIATIFGTDQSPSNVYRAYWTQFLNQETPVFFGTEKYAKDFDQPVIYGKVSKSKRGFYTMEFELLTETPSAEAYGEITEKHVRVLEKQIRSVPQHWLWTHKRWKRTKPADFAEKLAELKAKKEKL
ncbi:MAG: lipid A biosynthesis protein [Saprospiraceae bacterium]